MLDKIAFNDSLEARKAQAIDILNAVGDALFSVDKESRVTFANKEMGMLLDQDVNSLIGKNIGDLIPEHSGWTFYRYLERAQLNKTFVKLDYFKFANKRFEVYFYPLPDGLTIVLHDITLKWHTDELLRLGLFMLDRLNESVFLVRFDGRLFHVNNEACRLLGYRHDELIHMKIFDVDPGVTVEGWQDEFNSIKERKQVVFESRYKARDGMLIPVEVSVNFIELYGNEYYCVAARDITERMRNEEKKFFLSAIVESSDDAIISMTLDGIIISWNAGAERMFGYSADEIIGKSKSIIIPSDNADELALLLNKVKNGELITHYETVRLRKDGKPIDVSISISQIKDKSGYIIGASNIIRDISERKQAEEALRKSEAELARAQQISCIGSWVWDLITDEVSWSDQSYRNYGLVPGEVKSTYELFLSFIVPEDRERVDKEIRRAIEAGEKYRVIYNIIRKDGAARILLSENEIITDGTGKVIQMYGTNQDITERKQAESELEEARDLAELYLDLMGHDINNTNMVALGYLELANDLISSGGTLDNDNIELIEKPINSLNTSSKLIENVMKLKKLKTRELRLEQFDICDLLSRMKDRYSHVTGRDVTINYVPSAECMVLANGLIDEIFINLIENSIKHSPHDKPLVIDISQYQACADGKEYIRISVEDNGPGIPDSVKEKLFTRLYRGQTIAKGKGLGLYLVKTLVKEFGGNISVEDRVIGDYTKGCRFVVMMPAL